MTPSDSIEETAPTVDEAVRQALAKLGAQQDDVTIEVLSTPRAGVLGLGVRQARVRVTSREPEAARSGVASPPPAPSRSGVASPPPAPSRSHDTSPRQSAPSRHEAPPRHDEPPRQGPPRHEGPPRHDTRSRPDAGARSAPPPAASPDRARSRAHESNAELEGDSGVEDSSEGARKSVDVGEQTREASAILRRILELMGEKTEIEIVGDAEPGTVELNIKGDGSGILIGRHGQTLDALEYLVNRMLARKVKDTVPIALDSESYRARRRRQLHRTALSKGEEAKREHTLVTLDPMPPRDRRIIHLALKDDPMIVTRSAGDGFLRSVEIAPVDSRRERGEQRGGGERERKPERDQVGQQGGFKHGQKRIV